jgi:hypothetical protein
MAVLAHHYGFSMTDDGDQISDLMTNNPMLKVWKIDFHRTGVAGQLQLRVDSDVGDETTGDIIWDDDAQAQDTVQTIYGPFDDGQWLFNPSIDANATAGTLRIFVK